MDNKKKNQHKDGWNSDEIFRSMRRNAEAYKKKDMELIKVKEELEIHKKNTDELNDVKKELNHSNNTMNSVSLDLKTFIKPFKCEVDVFAEKGDFDACGEYNFNASININGDNEISFKFYDKRMVNEHYQEDDTPFWKGSLCLNDYKTCELGVVYEQLHFENGKFLDLDSRYKAYRIFFKENNLLLLYLQLKGYDHFTNGYWPCYTDEEI
jgi:hypothetical protein